MSSVGDIFNMDLLASLTERLAQAEREKAKMAVEMNRRDHESSKIERERDAAKERADALGEGNMRLRGERDAALAKAEAADECAEALKVDAVAWREPANSVADSACELADLRARIEALADEWEKYQSMNCYQARQELRALLKPAKPKTALELLSEVVGYLDEPISSQLAHTLAKLRKLLEEQK